MKPRAVAVTWHDHYHYGPGRWISLDDLDDVSPCEVISCGFLIRKTDDVLVIAENVTEAGDASGVFVIVRSCVKGVKRLWGS